MNLTFETSPIDQESMNKKDCRGSCCLYQTVLSYLRN